MHMPRKNLVKDKTHSVLAEIEALNKEEMKAKSIL